MLSRYSFHFVFIITLLLASIITTYYTYSKTISSKLESIEKNELARVKQRMHELQGTMNDLIRKKNFDSIQLEISRLASDPSLNYIYVVSKDLTVEFSTDFAHLGRSLNKIDASCLQSYIENFKIEKFGFTTLDKRHEKNHIYSVYPISDVTKKSLNKKEIKSSILISSFDLSKKEEAARYELQVEILISLGGYLSLIFFVAFVLYFNVKARTKKIVEATKVYANGDYGTRIEMEGGDEFKSIGDSIDGMANQIQKQYKKLKLSEQQAQQYLDIAKVFIAVVDTKGKITLLNKEAISILDKDARKVSHNRFLELFYFAEDRKKMREIESELLSGEYKNGKFYEFALGSEEKETHIISWRFATVVENNKVVGYLASGIDISKQKEAAKALYQLAHYDSLTNLTNRRYFLQRLDDALGALSKESSIALLFIDLDRFKVINDTMGHHVGDEMLQVIGSRLKNILKEEDVIARFGGDEFVVLLTNNISKYDLEIVIQRILSGLSQSMILNGSSISTTASIGVAIAPEHANEASKLLQYADIAMYEAKNRGKNRYAIYESYDESIMLERLSLQNDLSSALKNGEIKMYYQAQYNSVNNRITGYEALVRWKHPKKGFIRPDIFIQVAEESGFMLELGAFILKQSCKEFKEFTQGRTSKCILAVNISAIQFNDKGFINSLKDAINFSGIKHDELELEITEGILLDDIEGKIKLLQEIRSMGIQVSIDDFGTGYSSLSYLKRLPISKLKIDQSFVRDILTDDDDKAIVKTVISMAKSLRLKVIAEGVETKEQVEFLRANGCVNIQGYYYAKPLPMALLQEQPLS